MKICVQSHEALSRVRSANDLVGWVLFFLDSVSETAKTGCKKFCGKSSHASFRDGEQRINLTLPLNHQTT